ncbi:minor extracellular serine protease Vpr [Halobacillus dabanensis]|uniref:Minor extracellular serine protease Vpr n=1 Tax=Halobacillus dabanensis TaxID=240302 RepID=A0A1I3X7Q9_HALDA|nr:S8 family serine peptidase [Halobacillus dabanensis]SFK15357.1 minor extracellular serine protease Vpr [Halobacillus dabanensis]
MRYLFLTIITTLIMTGFSAPGPDEEVTIIVELEEPSETFIAEVERRLPRLEIVASYDTIFNGVAIRGTAAELEKVARMDVVKNQYPVHQYEALKEEGPTFSTEKIRESFHHPQTGEGVKVGVIDTGIDYNHPDLQKNYKGGYDTVDFDDDPMETKEEGATSHGTHVAGVIAADGEMEGIAPDADIYAYRALGPGGVGSSVQVIAALEEAVKDGMDVINLSLGNDVNGPDWPTTHAVNKAIELGSTVVVAAGNSGPDAWTIGSPATSTDAITVGASALDMNTPFLQVAGVKERIGILLMAGSKEWDLNKKYPVQYVGTGEKEIGDLKGKIALFERGGIPFSHKALKAYQQGAVAVLIYNNEEGAFQGGMDGVNMPIPVASISKKAGEWLKTEAIQENQWVETVNLSLGDQVAPFSSRGPVTTNWQIKPDVLAPGVDIYSTVPGGYESLQGTSMAAPHVAGIAALMKEAHPDWGPSDIKQAITSTADPVKNGEKPFPPTEQGAGFVDMNGALTPSLMIDKSSLSFGKTEDRSFRKELPLTIKNLSKEPLKITVEKPERITGESWTIPMPFEIPAQSEKEMFVELRVSTAFLDDGVHEGYLSLQAGEEQYSIPYVYVKEQSDYQKVSGFELTQSWQGARNAAYRFHLAEKVEKGRVDLYRAGTMLSAGTILEWKGEEVEAGLIEGEIDLTGKALEGNYIAIVSVETEAGEASYPFPVYIEGIE